MTEYRIVETNEDAVRLGFPNLATYRYKMAKEIRQEEERAYQEDVAKHQAQLAKKLQWHGELNRFYTGASSAQQDEATRARNAEQAIKQGDIE
jgi:hypothetical protein